MNDLEIKNLINSAVDAELGGRRAAPPFDPAAVAERPGRAHALRLWSAPLLAASVAVLLTVGAMLAITSNRGQKDGGKPAGPAPAPSLSWFTNPDQEEATRAYQEAVANAAEPTEAAGVSVEPLSARDGDRLRDTGQMSGDISSITAPTPGKTYSFTLSYLAGPSDDPPTVLTTELSDVASGKCAQPFLARPGHAYVIRCQAVLRAGVTGKATIKLRSPTGTTAGSMNLTGPAGYPASPSASISSEPDELASAYGQAVASAPEASKVAGVSERPATAEERQRTGESTGGLNTPVAAPKPGKSYPMTFLYIPPSDAPAISVLAIRFEEVAAGRCPGPFRIRPGHAYQIHCQVTFRAGAEGLAYYRVTGPRGVATTGVNLSYR